MSAKKMNLLSMILKELAQECQIPKAFDKKLFQRLFLTQATKEKIITEKTDHGRTKRISDKSTSG